ncbi:MAG TPA: hypothetical protein DD412_04610 [Holosporales bacterium]|nr:hypothetical protein [Holosporales bacterium]
MRQKIKVFFVSLMIISSFFGIGPLQASDDFREIRFGLQAHDLNGKGTKSHENGMTFNGEYIFASPQNGFFQFFFAPHPHVGLSLNSGSGTSMAYAGLTWVVPFQEVWFAELRFGGAIHNGKVGKETKKKKDYGARVLFHTGLSLGYVLFERHTLSILVNHISNGGFSKPNPGFTDLGLRYGYRF